MRYARVVRGIHPRKTLPGTSAEYFCDRVSDYCKHLQEQIATSEEEYKRAQAELPSREVSIERQSRHCNQNSMAAPRGGTGGTP